MNPSETPPDLLEEVPAQLVMERVVPPQDDTLTQIRNLSRKLIELIEQERDEELTLERTKQQIKEIAERSLPDLLNSVGLTEVRTAEGQIVGIKKDYYASIKKENQKSAFDWLRAHNMGGVIKEEIVVPKDQRDALIAANISHEISGSVHASTLKALAKEQSEAGTPLPRELFGVYEANKVVVK